MGNNGNANETNQYNYANTDHSGIQKGNLCMKGRIYPNKGGYVVRFGRGLSKWFKHEVEAERFLIGIRYETDKGIFDPRDYHKSRPLAFSNLADKWLSYKKDEVKRKSFNNLNNYMERAKKEWDDMNIKHIDYAHIQDLLRHQTGISDKTKANMKSCLHDFWTWLKKRKIITYQHFPEFPETPFDLGYRNITDIGTQQDILSEVKKETYHINPKIWLGIKWLSTYISMRPTEMLNILEEHIIPEMGILYIKDPKEKSKKRPKKIYLNDDDIELLRNMPRGLPTLYFFRHPKGINGVKAGQKFGEKYLYKKWKKACEKLGIHDLDMYGGTRHTTTTALSESLTPEQIKKGTLHSTNKAFERYFQADFSNERLVYQTAKDLQHTYNINSSSDHQKNRHKVLKLR